MTHAKHTCDKMMQWTGKNINALVEFIDEPYTATKLTESGGLDIIIKGGRVIVELNDWLAIQGNRLIYIKAKHKSHWQVGSIRVTNGILVHCTRR